MNKLWKKVLATGLAGIMTFGLTACGSSGGEETGNLVFMICDSGQKAGMEAMANA